MSATPEVRYWQHVESGHVNMARLGGGPDGVAERDPIWREVTVTPVVPQGATTPADERLCEAADRRGFVMLRDDATDDELAHADREFVDAVRAALAAPADETAREVVDIDGDLVPLDDLAGYALRQKRAAEESRREAKRYFLATTPADETARIAAVICDGDVQHLRDWPLVAESAYCGRCWDRAGAVLATLAASQASNHTAERIAQALRHVAQEYRLAAATGHLFFTATDSERVPWEAVARDLDERAERMLPRAAERVSATPADPGFEVWQRLARAAFQVDSTHHFHEGPDGRPVCACGFVGSARKRSQTEHITAAVLEAFDHD